MALHKEPGRALAEFHTRLLRFPFHPEPPVESEHDRPTWGHRDVLRPRDDVPQLSLLAGPYHPRLAQVDHRRRSHLLPLLDRRQLLPALLHPGTDVDRRRLRAELGLGSAGCLHRAPCDGIRADDPGADATGSLPVEWNLSRLLSDVARLGKPCLIAYAM